MRLAILSPYDPRPPEDGADPLALRGGVEEALDRTAKGMAARGHDVTLVCSAPASSTQTDVDGVRVVRVKRRGVVFRNPLAPLRRAIPWDAEVVHVPATYAFVSDVVPLLERRATVLDYHFDVHGTSAPMRAAAWTHRQTLGRGMLRATRVVCKSLDYARHSRVLRRVPEPRLRWVPNGVDVDEFDADAARGEDVVCVGRLVPYKGVDVLVRAAPRIHRETGARVVVIGDGPERARLEAMAKGAPVEFLGRLPREEVRRRLATARVAVLPSVNSQEAFGIALLEAMASGAPVVASDLPGVREVAKLGGITAPPCDPDALAQAVALAWHKPAAFGSPRDLRARVAATYGWPAVLDRWERVYREAVT